MHMANDAHIARSVAPPQADHCRSADAIARAQCSDLLPSPADDVADLRRCGVAMRSGLYDPALFADEEPSIDSLSVRACAAAVVELEAPSSPTTGTVGPCATSSSDRRRRQQDAQIGEDGYNCPTESDQLYSIRSDDDNVAPQPDRLLQIRRPYAWSSSPTDLEIAVGEELKIIATRLKPLKCSRGESDMDQSLGSDRSKAGEKEISDSKDGRSDLEGLGETTTATEIRDASKEAICADAGEECVTPRGAEFRIPEAKICPPAPRKKRHPPKRRRC